MPLSDTARAVLADAAERADRLAILPGHLPAAARNAVIRSMLKNGFVEQVVAEGGPAGWRATEVGLAAVSIVNAGAPVASQSSRRDTLREVALALVAAWDENPGHNNPHLAVEVEALRAKLTATVQPNTTRQPRSDTKRAAVLTLLRRPEGATVPQVAEATGWARHTVHGFLAGLKKNGIEIDVLERVRQVGAGPGSKGSYTVYRARETV